jgi:hypothetical protein
MPRKPESRGGCAFCGETLLRRGIEKHLAACPQYQQAQSESNQPSENIWRIRVQDAYSSDYWLELDMRGSASLTQLDKYLRAIWLECCGHLSEFTLGGWGGRKLAKARKADEAFAPGMVIRHIYDFGTSSETDIRVQDTRHAIPLSKHPITLLARNLPPQFTCQDCGKPATCWCQECVYAEEKPGFLCDEHAEEHPHEDYGGVMKVVNSPRMGMCGYDGPAEAPY